MSRALCIRHFGVVVNYFVIIYNNSLEFNYSNFPFENGLSTLKFRTETNDFRLAKVLASFFFLARKAMNFKTFYITKLCALTFLKEMLFFSIFIEKNSFD